MPGEPLRIAAEALRKANDRLAIWSPKRGLDRLFETTVTCIICCGLENQNHGRAFDWELPYDGKNSRLDLGIFDIPAGVDIGGPSRTTPSR